MTINTWLTNLVQARRFAHMHNADILKSREAADILGVSIATFNRLVTRGDIPVEYQFPGYKGPRLFRRLDVERAAQDKKRPAA